LCYGIFAFSITLIREIIKDMEDIRGDMRFGSKTLPIIWGFRKTKVFLYGLISIFTILFIGLAIYINNNALNIFFLILIFPILYLAYLLYLADTQRKFFYLSMYCKMLMLAGILSMTFF
jgi:4-hydroxybenzoate polyprenyltransferase